MYLGNHKKILIISDTHFGSIKENMNYSYMVYDFAINESITLILHGGDLLDGLVEYAKKYSTYQKQIEHVIKDYPYDKTIKNYILYGNHDYKFIKNGIKLKKMLSERKDFFNIGTQVGTVTISNKLILLDHKIKKCHGEEHREIINSKNAFLNFKGHAHKYEYNIEKNAAFIPTLSDDIFPYNNVNCKPGFIVLEFNSDSASITNYIINDHITKVKTIEKQYK